MKPFLWYSASNHLPKPGAEALAAVGFQLYQQPMLQIDYWLDRDAGFQKSIKHQSATHVLITSKHGVEASRSLNVPSEIPILVGGPETARDLSELALPNIIIPLASPPSTALHDWITRQTEPTHLLHLCGRYVSPQLEQAVALASSYLPYPIYESRFINALPKSFVQALTHARPTVVTLHSERSASCYRQLIVQHTTTANASIAALSQTVADIVPDTSYLDVYVAKEPTAASMHNLLVSLADKYP